MQPLNIVFAGTPEPAVVALERLVASRHHVRAVITRPDAPKGRGRTLHPSPVAAWAKDAGIEVLTPRTLKPGTEDGEQLRADLSRLAPDVIPVVAYGNLITADLLAPERVRHGWINLHFSLLPRWRGAAPVQAAIAAGDTETGVSTFRIDQGLDTGQLLATQRAAIAETDTADDLLTRLAHQGADLLAETMDGLAAGTLVGRDQEGEPTYAPKITSAQARVDWTGPAAQIDRLVRAYTPAPGAWTMFGDLRLKLGPVVPCDPESEDVPAAATELGCGQVLAGRHEVFVGTGSEPVRLTRVQPPGKKMMAAADWARGALSRHSAGAHEDTAGSGKAEFQ